MKKLAIFASGNGSNAQNITEHFKGSKSACISLIISNKPEAYVLERASALGVPTAVIPREQLTAENPAELLALLEANSIDYIIPGAHQPRINIPKDTVTISRMAYGYSVELSPLQILTFYNGIANDGRMISPVLVTEVKDGKTTVESFETQTIRSSLCSKKTLEDIQASLLDVVWDNDLGTAAMNKWRQRKAQSDLVKIAGKTGTAQVMENGKYFNNKHRMSFVGYFPADAPRYSCICVIHAPRNRGAYDSGLDCGSVVRKIAEKTMVYTSEYRIEDKQLVMKAKED